MQLRVLLLWYSGYCGHEAGLICCAAAINTVQGHYTSRGADVSVQLRCLSVVSSPLFACHRSYCQAAC